MFVTLHHPTFELLVLPLEDDLEMPFFRTEVKEIEIKMTTDFRFTFTNQCPFMESYVEMLSNKVVEHGYTVEVKKTGLNGKGAISRESFWNLWFLL